MTISIIDLFETTVTNPLGGFPQVYKISFGGITEFEYIRNNVSVLIGVYSAQMQAIKHLPPAQVRAIIYEDSTRNRVIRHKEISLSAHSYDSDENAYHFAQDTAQLHSIRTFITEME